MCHTPVGAPVRAYVVGSASVYASMRIICHTPVRAPVRAYNVKKKRTKKKRTPIKKRTSAPTGAPPTRGALVRTGGGRRYPCRHNFQTLTDSRCAAHRLSATGADSPKKWDNVPGRTQQNPRMRAHRCADRYFLQRGKGIKFELAL